MFYIQMNQVIQLSFLIIYLFLVFNSIHSSVFLLSWFLLSIYSQECSC